MDHGTEYNYDVRDLFICVREPMISSLRNDTIPALTFTRYRYRTKLLTSFFQGDWWGEM